MQCKKKKKKSSFTIKISHIVSLHAGFQENLKFGFGTNAMTGGQKGNLIYGGLALGFLLFMSGYLME